ncbi:MAG TPA: hypothetical protein VGF68_15010 [Solirubrobacteraceae bacterium]
MSRDDRRGRRRMPLGPDADAMTVLNRALDMARRRLRYRIGAALIIGATVVAALVLAR